MGEQLYTLADARLELNKQECDRYGHNYRITHRGDGTPTALICERCGLDWPVGNEEAIRYREILERMAREDYRGNRPGHITEARRALGIDG